MTPAIRVNVDVKANLAEMIRATAWLIVALGTLIP
jgi:hypothetical protein